MSKFSHENSMSKKGHNSVKNEGLPPLLVWVPRLIVNNYSEFQVNIYSNNRDIRKCQSFRTKTAELKRKSPELIPNTIMPAAMGIFLLRTQEQVRNSHGKRVICVRLGHPLKHTCDIFFEPDREIWDFSEGDWGLR